MQQFLLDNRNTFLVFFITLIVFTIAFSLQITKYEQDIKNNPKIPFIWFVTGDETNYLSIASDIVYHHSIYLEDHFLNQFSGKEKDPFMTWPDSYKDPTTWGGEFVNGHWISVHGLGLSYMLVPGYALGGIFGAMFTMSVLTSFTAVFIYKFTSQLTVPKIGFITTIIFSFSTILLGYSNQIYSDVVITLFLITTLYFIVERNNSRLHMSAAGTLLGFGVFLKISFIMIDFVLIALIIFLLSSHRITKKNFVIFIIFFVFLSCLAILNNIYTYHSITGGEFTEQVLGLFQNKHNTTDYLAFNASKPYRLDVIIESFFGKDHGLFIFSPIVMLSVLGVGPLLKKNRLLFITIVSLSILTIVGYAWVTGLGIILGGDPLFRYYLPVLPLMSIPFALGFQRFSNSIFYKICMTVLVSFSSFFSLAFAYNRWNMLAHLSLKSNLVHTAYRGFETIFPQLGPTIFGNQIYPMHHSLDLYNLLFLITILCLLCIGIIISFAAIKNQKQA